jgi:GT2 family glycosyltransferase
VVNHNTRELLARCLESVCAEPAGAVVVVDNASTDGSAAMVRERFPGVQLLANRANLGYGAGANQAIRQCAARYVLLLNSDTLVQPGALAALSAYFEAHAGAGLVGPRLLYPNGRPQASCYAFPTPLHVLLEETTLIRHIAATPGLRHLFLHTRPYKRALRVPWVLGAALAVRRSAFEVVGGFDERFFMYAEEIDLSYRLWEAGWETHFTPNAVVVHVGGASTRQRRAAMARQFFTSLALFYRFHYGPWRQVALTGIIKGVVSLRYLRDTARLRWPRPAGQQAALREDLEAWRQILAAPAAGGLARQ